MRIGVTVGFTAWILVLGGLMLANGRADALLPVVLPLFLTSLGLALLTLVAVESTMPDSVPATRFPVGFGATALSCGVLLLLVDGFIVPIVDADPVLGSQVRSAGGVVAIPPFVTDLLLALGCALLAHALRVGDRARTAAGPA